jgi:hypothetical protein
MARIVSGAERGTSPTSTSSAIAPHVILFPMSITSILEKLLHQSFFDKRESYSDVSDPPEVLFV